jgi:hypothetical protein
LIAAAALAAAALSAAGIGTPPRLALSVSPTHLALAAGGRATVRVGGISGGRLVLRTSVAGLALDGRGRPQVVGGRDAAPWLRVHPRTILAGPAGAVFSVASRLPSGARPGDHTAIVLVTATKLNRKGIVVAIRVGLVVAVRVSGRSIRRVEVLTARARPAPRGGRLVAVTIANRGDRIESIGGSALKLSLVRRGRVLARLRGVRRKLLPRTRAVVTFHVPPRIRGEVVALVAIARPVGKPVARRFPLRL